MILFKLTVLCWRMYPLMASRVSTDASGLSITAVLPHRHLGEGTVALGTAEGVSSMALLPWGLLMFHVLDWNMNC